MKELFLLLKASMSKDMNVFKYKSKNHSNFLLPIFLSLIIMFSVYVYAEMIGNPLFKVGLNNVLLVIFALFIVITIFMEGIYKSQGILFQAKDNNLLFSLPIKKRNILATRIIKLLAFEYIFEFLFVIPVYIKYIMSTPTNFNFYFITIIFLILLHIIHTILSSIIGYIITTLSVKTKFKNIFQTLFSFIFILIILFVSFNIQNIIGDITKYATTLNDLISKIYLPIGIYIELIEKFNLLKFIEMILINIVPFILFILIFSFKYDKIINKSKESDVTIKSKNQKIEVRNINKSLLVKELKRYFSSPIYIFNTAFGIIILLVATIGISFNFDLTINKFLGSSVPNISIKEIKEYLPQFYLIGVLFIISLSNITSSSISLEGNKFDLLKSLPISPKTIFNAKINMSNVILIPVTLISSLIFIIVFKVYNIFALYLLVTVIIFSVLIAIIGLLVNLKYPKFDFNSDVEVVKQGFSTLVALLIGLFLSIIFTFVYINLKSYFSVELLFGIMLLLYSVLTVILYKILIKYGSKRFYEI